VADAGPLARGRARLPEVRRRLQIYTGTIFSRTKRSCRKVILILRR
jgi:hypothetical protein